MQAEGTPAATIDHHWQHATRDLDHPHSCRLAMIFSAGSPAWPIEYALKIVAAEVQPLLSIDAMARATGFFPLESGLHQLLGIYTRLRAAMYRVPHYPEPVLPKEWPASPSARLLGVGGGSALAAATRVLSEIETGIARGSGHVLRLESADGKPTVVDPEMSVQAEAYERWLRRTLDSVHHVVLRGVPHVDGLEPEVASILPVLKEEHRQWLEHVEWQQSPGQGKPKAGGPQWRRAQRKLLDRLGAGTLPKSLREAAKVIGENYSPTRNAAIKSETLAIHFELEKAAARTHTDDLLDTLSGTMARQFKKLPRDTRDAVENEWRYGDKKKALELLTTLGKDPDAGSTGDIPYIELAHGRHDDSTGN